MKEAILERSSVASLLPSTLVTPANGKAVSAVKLNGSRPELLKSPDKRPVKLSIKDLVIGYLDKQNGNTMVAVDKVNLDIREGEFVTIVGLSGCGKSTFLNAIAGLVKHQQGQIRVNDRIVSGPGTDRAMVFQKASLLPWRKVGRNITYGLELGGMKQSEARKKASYYVNLVRLNGFENHYPHQLSGGMQQRVNLARALACDPEVLLLDEPFAALDAITRELMQGELLELCEKVGKTVLMVTHQIDEAVLLSDRVIVFAACPAHVLADIAISIPRPRKSHVKDSEEFRGLMNQIWAIIEDNANIGSGI
ncbi:MAG: ABC transporter ATP-binding protein [Chlorobium sp.]|nr:MAG: ABC transporter ATP-binding protein [Chlorobium sp.]